MDGQISELSDAVVQFHTSLEIGESVSLILIWGRRDAADARLGAGICETRILNSELAIQL